MFNLESYVRNRSPSGGCIAKGYIVEEYLVFAFVYNFSSIKTQENWSS